jgi:hypothetical protein
VNFVVPHPRVIGFPPSRSGCILSAPSATSAVNPRDSEWPSSFAKATEDRSAGVVSENPRYTAAATPAVSNKGFSRSAASVRTRRRRGEGGTSVGHPVRFRAFRVFRGSPSALHWVSAITKVPGRNLQRRDAFLGPDARVVLNPSTHRPEALPFPKTIVGPPPSNGRPSAVTSRGSRAHSGS